MADDQAVLRIGEVSRRTGVAVPTLRAWERRYGLLAPERTEGGHRLYREADVTRVRGMQRLLDQGWSAAAAAREVLREPAPVTTLRPVGGSGPASNDLATQLEAAIDRFDAPACEASLDDIFARFEVPRALVEVILPVVRRLGDGWEDDPRVISREHFATNTLRPRLQRLLRTPLRPGQPGCLAAAPEGEEHDLGLLAAAIIASTAGWRVHYLGARMPTRAIERSVRELAPGLVLIGAIYREHAEAFLDSNPRFDGAATVLGGAGFVAADAERITDAVVHEGPLDQLPSTFARAEAARGATG
ncbi:MAG: MerR family transcriptional regulator [Nitriliruptoraceae bacterium]